MHAATISMMILLFGALGFGFVAGAFWGLRSEERRKRREMIRARKLRDGVTSPSA